MKHFNGLTPAEAERLAYLLEELGETQQIIGKILRHGYESYDPTKPMHLSNRKLLENELADVQKGIDRLCEKGDIDCNRIKVCSQNRSNKYFHHQEDK